MHVAHCLSHSTVGGGQQIVYSLVSSFLRHHPDVRQSVFLPAHGAYVGQFKSLGVPVTELPFDRLFLAARKLPGVSPDVVHSHGKGAGLVRLRSAALHVHSYHGLHPPPNIVAHFLYLRLERYLLGKSNAVVTASRSEHDDVLRNFPAAAAKIALIPHQLDPEEVLRKSRQPLPPEFADFLEKNKNRVIVSM